MMWLSVYKGDLVEVKRLVEDGKDVNCTVGENKRTPLHVAIENQHTAVSEYLISLPGCDLEARTAKGWTPLHAACYWHSNLNIVKILVGKGINVNAVIDSGHTGLHLAIQRGYTLVAEYLTSLPGCDLKARNSSGFTPLHAACYYHSNIDIVKILVQKGIDINAGTKSGQTCLHLAILGKHTAVAEYLISLPDCDLEVRTDTGVTPLHCACYFYSNIDIVKLLVQNGIEVNAVTDSGHTGLHLAIHQRHTSVAEYLISLPDCDLETKDCDRNTPLHCACYRHSNIKIVKILTQKGININASINSGHTGLHLAIQEGHTAAAKYLISLPQCDIQIVTNVGKSALDIAKEEHNSNIIVLLIKKALHTKHANISKCHLVNKEGIYYIRKSDITISNPNRDLSGLNRITLTSQPVTESEIPDGGEILSQMITLEPHGMVFDKHCLVKFPINQQIYRQDLTVCLMYSDGSYGGHKEMHWVNMSQENTPAVHKDEMFWFIHDGYCYLYTRHFSHIFLLQTADPVSPQHGIFLLVSLYAKYVKRKLVITVGFHCHRCFENLLEAKGNFGTLLDYTFHCVYDRQGSVAIQLAVDNNTDWECDNPEKKIHVDQLLPLCHLGAISKHAFVFRAKGEVNYHRQVKVDVKVLQDVNVSSISAELVLNDISEEAEPSTKDVEVMTDFPIFTPKQSEPATMDVEVMTDFPLMTQKQSEPATMDVEVMTDFPLMTQKQSEPGTMDVEVMTDFPLMTQKQSEPATMDVETMTDFSHEMASSLDESVEMLQPKLAGIIVSSRAIGAKSKPEVTEAQNIMESAQASQQALANSAGESHGVGMSDISDLHMHTVTFTNDQYNSNAFRTTDKSVTGNSTTDICTIPKRLDCSQPGSVSGELFLPQSQDNNKDRQASDAQILQESSASVVHVPDRLSQLSNIHTYAAQHNQQIQGNNTRAAGFNQFYPFYQNINYQITNNYNTHDTSRSDFVLQLPETDCVFNRSVVSEQEKLCDIIDKDCKDQLAEIAKAVGDTNGTVDIKNITALSLLQVWKVHVNEEKCTWRQFYDLLVRLGCQSAAQQLKVVYDKDSLVRGINKLKQDISLDSELCGILLELDVINLAEYDEIQLMKSPLEKISFLVLELLVKKPGNHTRVKGFYEAMDSTRYYSEYIRAFMLCPEDIINC